MRFGTRNSPYSPLGTAAVIRRWAKIEDELDQIQKEVSFAKHSPMKKFTEWAGVVALVISISVGGYSFYDNVILGPEKTREKAISEMQDIIAKITKVNADLISGGQSVTAGIKAQIENGVKFPLIERAKVIIGKYGKYIDSASLLVVTYELLQRQDFRLAYRYAEEAKVQTQDPILKSESMRYMALASSGDETAKDTSESDKLFSELIVEDEAVKGVDMSGPIGSAIRDWATLTASLGKCDKALQRLKSLRSHIHSVRARANLYNATAQAVLSISSLRTCDMAPFQMYEGSLFSQGGALEPSEPEVSVPRSQIGQRPLH